MANFNDYYHNLLMISEKEYEQIDLINRVTVSGNKVITIASISGTYKSSDRYLYNICLEFSCENTNNVYGCSEQDSTIAVYVEKIDTYAGELICRELISTSTGIPIEQNVPGAWIVSSNTSDEIYVLKGYYATSNIPAHNSILVFDSNLILKREINVSQNFIENSMSYSMIGEVFSCITINNKLYVPQLSGSTHSDSSDIFIYDFVQNSETVIPNRYPTNSDYAFARAVAGNSDENLLYVLSYKYSNDSYVVSVFDSESFIFLSEREFAFNGKRITSNINSFFYHDNKLIIAPGKMNGDNNDFVYMIIETQGSNINDATIVGVVDYEPMIESAFLTAYGGFIYDYQSGKYADSCFVSSVVLLADYIAINVNVMSQINSSPAFGQATLYVDKNNNQLERWVVTKEDNLIFNWLGEKSMSSAASNKYSNMAYSSGIQYVNYDFQTSTGTLDAKILFVSPNLPSGDIERPWNPMKYSGCPPIEYRGWKANMSPLTSVPDDKWSVN